MAALSENKLRDEAQKKNLRGLYVLSCEDAFKINHYTDLLFKAWGKGEQLNRLYADEIAPDEILEQLQTSSLFSPAKFLVLQQGERMQAKQWEAFLPLLDWQPDGSCLVIQAAKVDARFKFFQALGKAESPMALVKMDTSQRSESSAWLASFLVGSGKELDAAARELCLDLASSNLSELKHLVERACLFSGDEKIVRREHVLAVGCLVNPEDIFAFTGSLLLGDRAAALSYLEKLVGQGEEALPLVGLLARQYRWLLQILTLRAEGENDATIASKAGIFPAAAKVLFPAARRLGSKGVVRGLFTLSQTDLKLKSSRLSKQQLLTELVLELSA